MSREKQISETRSRSKSKWKRASKSTRVLRVLSLLGRKEHQRQREESAKDRDDERKTLENGRSIDRRTLGYLHHLLYSDDAGPPTPKSTPRVFRVSLFQKRKRRLRTTKADFDEAFRVVDGRTEVDDDERIVRSNVLVLFVCVCVRSRSRRRSVGGMY